MLSETALYGFSTPRNPNLKSIFTYHVFWHLLFIIFVVHFVLVFVYLGYIHNVKFRRTVTGNAETILSVSSLLTHLPSHLHNRVRGTPALQHL